MKKQDRLYIAGKQTPYGIRIFVDKKPYNVQYPTHVWKSTPSIIRKLLVENLTVAETHFLPLFLHKNTLVYSNPQPFFDSFFFRNQIFDLLYCAEEDRVQQLKYLRHFYNLEYIFDTTNATTPLLSSDISFAPARKKTAILPFTFGKESLLTLGVCLELGIQPILVYSQEPSHPYEERYKLKQLKKISKVYTLIPHFIKHEPGMFRYGKVFNLKKETEIGWAGQTTILSFLLTPFAWKYGASYILYGSEYSNNDYDYINKWKVYSSFDQTSFWTTAQNNVIRALTQGNCEVKSMLEPLEEIVIFYMLHTRYKNLGIYQFSCHGKNKLLNNSKWCHKCSKCTRNYLFCLAIGIDPKVVGFEKNILMEKTHFRDYFNGIPGYDRDLDFAFYLLLKKDPSLHYCQIFKKKLLPKLRSWRWYRKHFTTLQSMDNIPDLYRRKIKKIYSEAIDDFKNNAL